MQCQQTATITGEAAISWKHCKNVAKCWCNRSYITDPNSQLFILLLDVCLESDWETSPTVATSAWLNHCSSKHSFFHSSIHPFFFPSTHPSSIQPFINPSILFKHLSIIHPSISPSIIHLSLIHYLSIIDRFKHLYIIHTSISPSINSYNHPSILPSPIHPPTHSSIHPLLLITGCWSGWEVGIQCELELLGHTHTHTHWEV